MHGDPPQGASLREGGGGVLSLPRKCLRAYQTRIVEEVLRHGNTIVVLPTGAGKTLIAAEVARQLGAPVLFLVPTCLLVAQQAEAMRAWTGLSVGEFMGGASLPSSFDVLVSTPKAFQEAQGRGAQELAWPSFRLVVFDEVHHVLKQHPYRRLALELRKLQAGAPRVLGLTASLTYAVGQKQVEAAVHRICGDLQIAKLCCADVAEMQAEGYHGTSAPAEVRTVDRPDVILPGVVPIQERKAHLLVQTFFQRVRSGEALPFSCSLLSTIQTMEAALLSQDGSFRSPLTAALKEWGAYANARAARSPMYAQIEHWYEALRIVVVSWEEAQDAAMAFLQMNGVKTCAKVWSPAVETKIDDFWQSAPASSARFEHLKGVLLCEAGRLRDFRGLLFVQQRVMTHILEHVIRSDPDLGARFAPACLYAASSPATASLNITAREARERLAAFADGSVNLLITTVVAEEGMDVPEANCVIRFDAMLNSVSFVQGRGRARQADSSFVVLAERPDRSAAVLAEVEQQQRCIVRDFDPTLRRVDEGQERAAQQQRELGAAAVLSSWDGTLATALAVLNLYCKKTKVELADKTEPRAKSQQPPGQWVCGLTYESVLRSIRADGVAADAKGAKREAAALLITQLQRR